MIGGRGKFAGRFALVAAAGLFAGSMSAGAADLEERVAELEATTVRKGTRKVALTLSGYVAHHIMYWDDGKVSDVYIGDGGNYYSRFRFVGSAKINAQVTAGFTMEYGSYPNQIGAMNQSQAPDGGNGDDLGTSFNIRDHTIWLDHKTLGRVKIGHGSTATDNLILIDLGKKGGGSTPDIALYNGAFRFRDSAGAFSTATWTPLIRGHESWDTSRRNHVLYQTPTLAGFNLQAAVAEDNYWDVALRYAGEFAGIRVAFGIGYQEDTENNVGNGVAVDGIPAGFACVANCTLGVSDLKGSGSILHVASGLFVTGAAGQRSWDRRSTDVTTAPGSKDGTFWFISGGVSKNWTGIGNTVIFGEYSEHDNMANNVRGGFLGVDHSVSHWGFGLTQHIDAAAMEMFIAYKNYSLDLQNGFALATPNGLGGSRAMGKALDLEQVIVGVKMSF